MEVLTYSAVYKNPTEELLEKFEEEKIDFCESLEGSTVFIFTPSYYTSRAVKICKPDFKTEALFPSGWPKPRGELIPWRIKWRYKPRRK